MFERVALSTTYIEINTAIFKGWSHGHTSVWSGTGTALVWYFNSTPTTYASGARMIRKKKKGNHSLGAFCVSHTHTYICAHICTYTYGTHAHAHPSAEHLQLRYYPRGVVAARCGVAPPGMAHIAVLERRTDVIYDVGKNWPRVGANVVPRHFGMLATFACEENLDSPFPGLVLWGLSSASSAPQLPPPPGASANHNLCGSS
ncbi:hypothetical protein BJV74DRAFT_794261 [Russula compacta]|nr:hypothetical protein BJV74DRAFT_794261 [Russula compacta]